MDNDDYQSSYATNVDIKAPIGLRIEPKEGMLVKRDALSLDLDDTQFVRTANKLINDSKLFFDNVYDLTNRRRELEKWVFGRQMRDVRMKPYQSRFQDNILYEALSYLKPIALSRLPDLEVSPGNETEESKTAAEKVSKLINSDLKSEERRRVLGIAFKHRPVYFLGALKPYWDPTKGKTGDYAFRTIHPNNLILDHTCASLDPQEMTFIAESIQYNVKEWVMKFPDKEEEFYKELAEAGIFNDKVNQNNLAGQNSPVKGWEIWFTWFDKVNGKFEKIDGVAWFYRNLVLQKIKNPYWDWEGDNRAFSFKMPIKENQLREAVTKQSQIPGFEVNKIFHNHFDSPHKPYILMGYDQWGKIPLDETSEFEQSLGLQRSTDKRGRQIDEMLDRRGKHIFSTDALKKEDVEEMDLANPDEDIIVDGDPKRVHDFIQSEQPSQPMLADLGTNRERIFQKIGVNQPLRGQSPIGDQTATETQIIREGDYTRADDLAEDTINHASREIANWVLQFIKLFYTKDHYIRLLGNDGMPTYEKINRDLVQDGMIVNITASGTDKLRAEQRAVDNAKLGFTDPLTYFKDTNQSDPVGRTEKLMMLKQNPDQYIAKFIMNLGTTNEMAGALSGDAQQIISQLEAGQPPQLPDNVDPAIAQAIIQWFDSPQADQVKNDPAKKANLLNFMQQLAQKIQSQPAENPPDNANPPSAGGTNNIGPVAPNTPQPGNTGQVSANPPMRNAGLV